MKTRKNSPAHSRFRFALLALLLWAPLRGDDKATVNRVVAASYIWGVTPTGSMEPTFNEHWDLLVMPAKWGDLKVGDVILFHSDLLHCIVCHRIWRISSGGSVMLTRGDGNGGYVDCWFVRERDLVGLVVGMVRNDLWGSAPDPVK